jgi:hypothetical protein
MNFNQTMINNYVDVYIEKYYKKFNEYPQSWFTFFAWLTNFTVAGSFDKDDVEYAKRKLGIN